MLHVCYSPQYIGFDATISAPHMHAYALELLQEKAKPGAHVLDVGCGSGYLTASFGKGSCNTVRLEPRTAVFLCLIKRCNNLFRVLNHR